jgi:hypothetical protein
LGFNFPLVVSNIKLNTFVSLDNYSSKKNSSVLEATEAGFTNKPNLTL